MADKFGENSSVLYQSMVETGYSGRYKTTRYLVIHFYMAAIYVNLSEDALNLVRRDKIYLCTLFN